MIAHRLQCAWSKFHALRHALTNRHVDVRLRMRFLDSVVTPYALYSLSTAPLKATDLERLAIAQRKMRRLIAGYTKRPDDSWADMYRRLNSKIDRATRQLPVRMWVGELQKSKTRLFSGVTAGACGDLLSRVRSWDPASVNDVKLAQQPKRKRGRPPTTWN